MITNKQYEKYLSSLRKREFTKVGTKRQAIEALKDLGWSKYGYKEMIRAFDNDRHPLIRIGNTYYWYMD